jgi:N-terminal domain of molybdenum-binding protein
MRFACRIPINDLEVPVDERMFKLLNLIHRMGSITVAARDAGIPYRSALAYIRNVEDILGENIVETRRGWKGRWWRQQAHRYRPDDHQGVP